MWGWGVSGATVGLGGTDDSCAHGREGGAQGLCSRGEAAPLHPGVASCVCANPRGGGGDALPTRGHRAQ